MIPYGRQDITQADIDAVVDVLQSDFLTQGPAVPAFEAALAGAVDAPHAVAVNSATSALHVACAALGVGPGDWLWTTPNTFVASANCGLYCGAQVDFVDIDARTYNFCPDRFEDKLKAADKAGRLPKVIVPVHFSGQPCDMDAIGGLARQYGVKVIEDASHAIGASYQGQPVGNGATSDITVFSFHPVKIVTTAEGGALTTRDAGLAAHMERLRSHGITRDPELMTHAPDGGWYYQQVELGWNYRITDIQAALGTSQLSRLGTYIDRRHEIARVYDAALGDMPLVTPYQADGGRSAYHLYVITLDDATRHRDVFEQLRARGVGVNLHYIPVHLQPYYQAMGFAKGDFPNAEAYYSRAISLPMFPNLSDDQQGEVIATLGDILG